MCPFNAASCRGGKVRVNEGFTSVPVSINGCVHLTDPVAQAKHSGVLPSMLRALTCKN